MLASSPFLLGASGAQQAYVASLVMPGIDASPSAFQTSSQVNSCAFVHRDKWVRAATGRALTGTSDVMLDQLVLDSRSLFVLMMG